LSRLHVSAQSSGARVAVFGAGAFGGWTALELVRRGARVTLLDAWGPGHARASSGGETRVIRATYGPRTLYTRMATRALELWRAHDARSGLGLLREAGVLWMFAGDREFARTSIDALGSTGVAIDELSVGAARERFPQIDFTGISSVLFEPHAGYLFARRACEHVVERLAAEGGEYRAAAAVSPVMLEHDGTATARRVSLTSGAPIEADAFVFACGPWLGTMFPQEIGALVTPTRQEVYYFGTPPGDTGHVDPRMPVWIDVGERVTYGIPGNAHRGFKFADDTPGPPFDPTHGEREATAAGVAAARAFLARRFPGLRGAPLLGAEICQYESTPDADFIVDRHPGFSNVWLVGGGSGHGFKMGPALGEHVASLVLGECTADPQFALARFATPPPGGWPEKWA
jgi:sarcosine oxidase